MSLAMTAGSIRREGGLNRPQGASSRTCFSYTTTWLFFFFFLCAPFSVLLLLLLLVFVLSFPFSTTPPYTSRHSQPPAPSSPKKSDQPTNQPASLCKVVSQLCTSSVNVLLTRSSAKYFIDTFFLSLSLSNLLSDLTFLKLSTFFVLHTRRAATSNSKPK